MRESICTFGREEDASHSVVSKKYVVKNENNARMA